MLRWKVCVAERTGQKEQAKKRGKINHTFSRAFKKVGGDRNVKLQHPLCIKGDRVTSRSPVGKYLTYPGDTKKIQERETKESEFLGCNRQTLKALGWGKTPNPRRDRLNSDAANP